MEIHFKGTHYQLGKDVTDRTSKKINALKKYLGSNGDNARAYVELGKETKRHQTGEVWKAEINLSSEGQLFRAVATGGTLENAIDESVNEIGKELRRAKKKNENMLRQGGTMLKSFMRGFSA